MSIITISRGSYSRGKEVAERLAMELGYECISREVLLEASEKFHLPEIKLIRAIHDAPSVLDRFTHGKEKYVAFVCEALLEHIKKDNVVYHGLAGHFFLQQVPHALKVRIIADLEVRVKEEMERESISEEEARYVLKKDDDERRKWSLSLYGADTWDSNLYDIVFHIKTMEVKDVVDILLHTVKRPCFQTTFESQGIVDDLVLTSRIKSALVHQFSHARVAVRNGNASIWIRGDLNEKEQLTQRVEHSIEKTPDIREIEVHVSPLLTTESLHSAYKILHFD